MAMKRELKPSSLQPAGLIHDDTSTSLTQVIYQENLQEGNLAGAALHSSSSSIHNSIHQQCITNTTTQMHSRTHQEKPLSILHSASARVPHNRIDAKCCPCSVVHRSITPIYNNQQAFKTLHPDMVPNMMREGGNHAFEES